MLKMTRRRLLAAGLGGGALLLVGSGLHQRETNMLAKVDGGRGLDMLIQSALG